MAGHSEQYETTKTRPGPYGTEADVPGLDDGRDSYPAEGGPRDTARALRPDLAIARELRPGLDPMVESPVALAPLIDPAVHSCGSVPPTGTRSWSTRRRTSTSSG
jgi:hypothetical protein